MSYYGHKTFIGSFSISKQLLEAPGSYRFGGVHGQLAYKISDGSSVPVTLHHSGVNVINAEESTVSIALIGVNPNAPATFSEPTIIDISGSYSVPSDKYAIVIDGSVDLDGTALDATTNFYKLDPGASVSGNAKLVVFGFNQP